MFTVYDIEVFPNDWMIVFQDTESGEVERIHNDRERLTTALSSKQFLVGFNNYRYDDLILAGLLNGTDPYELSQKIFANERITLRLNLPTLDVMQEAKQGVGLKEAMANLGLDIRETPVDFDKPKLTPEEIESVFHYCENDVRVTAELFKERDSYFSSKFQLVQTFKLKTSDLKKTRANMAATVLKATKGNTQNKDRLHLTYDKRLKLRELPTEIVDFYANTSLYYNDGVNYEDLEKESFVYKIAGLDHTFGFGGLHAAKENYIGEGHFLQIDVSSFYPSLMINNSFLSRTSRAPEDFKKIYDERKRLKAKKDPKEEVFKIVLNSTYGASKSSYNNLFDPLQANNVVVNGQLILTHLILLLEPFCELIQSNTDGIIVKYEMEMRGMIDTVLKFFSKKYELTFDVDEIKKIAQRDVNNYCMMYDGNKSGVIVAKGSMTNHDGGSWERNSLTILDKALVHYYMENKPIQATVIDTWKKGELLPFQLVAKAGKFDGMVHERLVQGPVGGMSGKVKLQNVNRIFATKDKKCGMVYKVRSEKGTDKLHKLAYCPPSALVWNEAVDQLDKRLIDLNWYVKTAQAMVF